MAKKTIKWTKKIENLILDEMAAGNEPALIFRKYADQLPSLRTFNRKQLDDPEFKEKVDAAYTVIYQIKQAELSELTSLSAKAAIEKYGTLTIEEQAEGVDFKSAAEFKKSRIDALKFELGKLAGVFSRRYDKKQTVEHTGNVQSEYKLVLPNWAASSAHSITSDKGKTIDVDKDTSKDDS